MRNTSKKLSTCSRTKFNIVAFLGGVGAVGNVGWTADEIYVTPEISLILNPFETVSVYMQNQMKTFSIQGNIKVFQWQDFKDILCKGKVQKKKEKKTNKC